MSVTFDGVTLTRPDVRERKREFSQGWRRLLGGRESAKTSSNVNFGFTIVCVTTSYSDIDAIAAKVGTRGTLSIGSDNHTNMMLTSPIGESWDKSAAVWIYTLNFRKVTAI